MTLKVLELFSGYGGASFALNKVEIDHKCIGYSDIEKCATIRTKALELGHKYTLKTGHNIALHVVG